MTASPLDRLRRRAVRCFLLPAMAVALSACATLAPDGPVPAAELQLALEGRSWLWEKEGPGAGIYFGFGGKGAVSTGGNPKLMTWSTQEGQFCYRNRGRACWWVFRKNGVYYSRLTTGGEPYRWHPVLNTVEGNRVY